MTRALRVAAMLLVAPAAVICWGAPKAPDPAAKPSIWELAGRLGEVEASSRRGNEAVEAWESGFRAHNLLNPHSPRRRHLPYQSAFFEDLPTATLQTPHPPALSSLPRGNCSNWQPLGDADTVLSGRETTEETAPGWQQGWRQGFHRGTPARSLAAELTAARKEGVGAMTEAAHMQDVNAVGQEVQEVRAAARTPQDPLALTLDL